MKGMDNRTEYIERLNLEMNKQSDIEALLIEFEQGRISRDEYIALSFMSHSVTRSDAHTDTFNRQQERIDKLKSTNPWIKVSERLPEMTEHGFVHCLIYRSDKNVRQAMFNTKTQQFCDFQFNEFSSPVTHWQLLPTAPKD